MSAQLPAQNSHFIAWALQLSAILFLGIISTANAAETGATDNTQPSPAQSPTAMEAPADTQRGTVARAIFTSQIIDREPADNLAEASNDLARIYFFTDLRGLEGQIITHRWEHKGNTMAEVKFKVGGGPRWRVYSSKNLLPEWTGEWTVIVTDESGWTLKAGIFDYTQAKTADISTPNEMEPKMQAPAPTL